MEFEALLHLAEALFSAFHVLPYILGVATYVLTGVGLYTMAKSRNIRSPWLSWVPGLNVWILGSLADQYRYVAKGQKKARRWILLGLKIAGWVISLIALSLSIATITKLIIGFFDAATVISEEAILNGILKWLMKSTGFFLVMIPVTVTFTVFHFIALYDLYLSCEPRNAVLYLVLSILFGVTQPFFLFFCRNKEEGMPPRKARQQPEVQAEPVRESWRQPEQSPCSEPETIPEPRRVTAEPMTEEEAQEFPEPVRVPDDPETEELLEEVTQAQKEPGEEA